MDKKDILKDLFGIIYDWIKPIIIERHHRLGGCWYNDSDAFYWDCVGKSSGTDAYIGARLCGDTDDIVIWTKNKNNIAIVIHPVEKSIFTGIYSVDVMLNTVAEFEDFSKEEMKDLYNRIIDFYKDKHHATILSEEESSDQYTTMMSIRVGRVICEKTLEEETPEKENKALTNLDRYVKTTKVFDPSKLKIGAPYKIHNVQTDEHVYVILEKAESEELTFGWFYAKEQIWAKWIVKPDDLLVITPLFEEDNNEKESDQ